MTYFLLSQLRVIRSAIDEVRDYLARKAEEVRETQLLLRQADRLNHRQLALLSHAIRNPGFDYSIRSHRASHGVVYETARADLLDLVELGLLNKRISGNRYRFLAPADLRKRLGAAGAAGAEASSSGPRRTSR